MCSRCNVRRTIGASRTTRLSIHDDPVLVRERAIQQAAPFHCSFPVATAHHLRREDAPPSTGPPARGAPGSSPSPCDARRSTLSDAGRLRYRRGHTREVGVDALGLSPKCSVRQVAWQPAGRLHCGRGTARVASGRANTATCAYGRAAGGSSVAPKRCRREAVCVVRMVAKKTRHSERRVLPPSAGCRPHAVRFSSSRTTRRSVSSSGSSRCLTYSRRAALMWDW
jgi:hypothetical protein